LSTSFAVWTCHALFGATLLVACAREAPSPVVAESPVLDTDVFQQTTLIREADGTIRSTTRDITVAEERRQNVARAARVPGAVPGTVAPAIEVDLDPDCPYSLWLYDRTDLTGNRICFGGVRGYDEPKIELDQYARLWRRRANGVPYVYARWNIAVGSYWPGDGGGLLTAPWAALDAGVGEVFPGGPIRFEAWGPPGSFAYAPDYPYEVLDMNTP